MKLDNLILIVFTLRLRPNIDQCLNIFQKVFLNTKKIRSLSTLAIRAIKVYNFIHHMIRYIFNSNRCSNHSSDDTCIRVSIPSLPYGLSHSHFEYMRWLTVNLVCVLYSRLPKQKVKRQYKCMLYPTNLLSNALIISQDILID